MRSKIVIGLVLWLALGVTLQAQQNDQPAVSPDKVTPLLIGAKVPQLTLKTAEGVDYDLGRAMAKQPTILILYRGGW